MTHLLNYTGMTKNTQGSHSHCTISAQPPLGSHTGAVQYPWDFYAQLRRQHNDYTISVRSQHDLSLYGFAPVRCRILSKKSHDGRIKYKPIHRSLHLTHDASKTVQNKSYGARCKCNLSIQHNQSSKIC